MSAYTEYKPCEGDWIKAIPSTWEIIRGKYLFKIKKRIVGEVGHDVLSITQKGIKVKDTESGDGQLSMDYSKYQIVEPGDFAMNHMDLLTGYVDISKYKGVTSPDYRVFTPNESEHSPRYFLYLFQMGYTNKIFFKYGQGASHLGRWRLPTEEFNNFYFPCPPSEEQQQIANFLDHETAKIDTLIDKQQQLISLLKEKRQAEISHTVTKGLNPDAPMRDSGVEWLGEVPAHWEVVRLKFLARLQTDKVTIGNKKTIALENIESWTGQYTPTNSNYTGEDVEFTKGDILFGKLRPYLAKVYQANNRGVAFGDLLVYRPKSTLFSKYCFYQMLNEQFINTVDSSTYGSKMPRASAEFISNMQLLLPPLEEQIKITSHIDLLLKKYEGIESKAKSAIKLMQERRTALISAAVTGKIDVRN